MNKDKVGVPEFDFNLPEVVATNKTVAVNMPVQQISSDPSVAMISMIQQAASDPNTDVAKMEKLWEMKERIDAKQAEGDFNQAMGLAQSKMGTIGVDKANRQTQSKYASYSKLDKVLRPIYTSDGFALSFNTEKAENPAEIRIICFVSHAKGHTRMYSIDMPADGKGAKGGDVMTKTHATGSAVSYGMRYLLKMIFNVAIGEYDDDGNQAAQIEPIKLITENQQNTIHAMLVENDLSESIFLSFLDSLKINGLANIPQSDYKSIVAKVKESIKQKSK